MTFKSLFYITFRFLTCTKKSLPRMADSSIMNSIICCLIRLGHFCYCSDCIKQPEKNNHQT